MKRLICLLLFITILIPTPINVSANNTFSDVDSSHWAYEEIEAAAAKNIINGYLDHSFRPSGLATEEQFAKIALLTLTEAELNTVGAKSWSDPYYDFFKQQHIRSLKGYQSTGLRKQQLTRGQAIQFVVELVSGNYVTVPQAIDYAFAEGLTNGKYPDKRSNIEKFAPTESLSRAQAVVFLSRVKEALDKKGQHHWDSPQVTDSLISVRGIKLDDSKQHVEKVLGKPKHSYPNEYGIAWNIYHQHYEQFVMLGFKNDKVVAIYTNQDLFSMKHNIQLGTTKQQIRQSLGTPLQYILKHNTKYIIKGDGEYDIFLIDGYYTTFFYDNYRNDTLTAIQIISEDVEGQKPGFYAKGSTELRHAFERVQFEVTNSLRKREGLPVFTWSEKGSNAARLHSIDMATNNYFSHTNLRGESPFLRIKNEGISYSIAAENIAYGQFSAIFVHEGWMNSLGHRNNILNNRLTHLGVGVAFQNDTNVPFYTQNFYAH